MYNRKYWSYCIIRYNLVLSETVLRIAVLCRATAYSPLLIGGSAGKGTRVATLLDISMTLARACACLCVCRTAA